MKRHRRAIVASAAFLLACGSETPTPELIASNPASGSTISRTAWFSLTFAEPPDAASLENFALTCDDEAAPFRIDAFAEQVIVNPAHELPTSPNCRLGWAGPSGEDAISFAVASAGPAAMVAYDRDDASLLAPFPDDSLLADGATATGKTFAPFELDRPNSVTDLLNRLFAATAGLDGFSPLASWIVDLPAALDPNSVPLTPQQSLDRLATIMLFDVDQESPDFGQRIPFFVVPKSTQNAHGELEHQLVIFPAHRLAPRGQYALIVTRRALVDVSRPLEGSPFMLAALGSNRTTDAQHAVGRIADEVMAVLSTTFPPLERDDIALVLRASIRSMDDAARDLLAVRGQLDRSPPPTFTIDEVTADAMPDSAVAAIVRGTWNAPRYSDGAFVNRLADGRPAPLGTQPIPFSLALPKVARAQGAPIVMYQHGSPGQADPQVIGLARSHLAQAGFAVIGFTQALDRETSTVDDQFITIFSTLITQDRFPDLIALQSNLEQLAFLRLIAALDGLDVLPMGAPDGAPDLDLSAPWSYLGISYGAHNGMGLLPFAPEIRAAALAVGGGRWSAPLVHQEGGTVGAAGLYEFVTDFYPDLRRSEFYVGLSLTQMAVDDQDWLNRAHLLYREPLGLGPPPSVLLTEGLHDNWIPPYVTETAAHELGIPQLTPISPVAFLDTLDAPARGNVGGTATGALFQYVPSEVEGRAPSAGCESEPEGHYCAPKATPAIAQRLHFFESALDGVPEIIAESH